VGFAGPSPVANFARAEPGDSARYFSTRNYASVCVSSRTMRSRTGNALRSTALLPDAAHFQTKPVDWKKPSWTGLLLLTETRLSAINWIDVVRCPAADESRLPGGPDFCLIARA